MTRKVQIEYPEAGLTVVASLLEKEEPEASELLWNYLAKPVKCAPYNTASTGFMYVSKARPPKDPVKIGTQANPVGRKPILLCDMKPGDIIFTGMDFWCTYGKNTEPLLGGGSIVMVVDPEYLEAYVKAGHYIWNCQEITHVQSTMIVSRKEN